MERLNDGMAQSGETFFAMEQTAGRGQREKIWQSEPGQNIMMSVVFIPQSPILLNSFQFSAKIALVVRSFIQNLLAAEVKIKWPNDLMINDRKAGGLLIENKYRGSLLKTSVIGIGINVNHPLEFWPESIEAIQRLKKLNITIYNQNPLLKGVNDNFETLARLYDLLRQNEIEAHYLFDMPYSHIEAVIHPQSVIHSMVEYVDGSTITQASPPSMKGPISFAINYPDRVKGATTPIDWTTSHTWTFAPIDNEKFPAIELARRCGQLGGGLPAIFNAANEVCVSAFIDGKIGFTSIIETVEDVVQTLGTKSAGALRDLSDVSAIENYARRIAQEHISKVAR
jgi:biotin-[acetyl-CoA-carboxylase] ligase BirA-like protein